MILHPSITYHTQTCKPFLKYHCQTNLLKVLFSACHCRTRASICLQDQVKTNQPDSPGLRSSGSTLPIHSKPLLIPDMFTGPSSVKLASLKSHTAFLLPYCQSFLFVLSKILSLISPSFKTPNLLFLKLSVQDIDSVLKSRGMCSFRQHIY